MNLKRITLDDTVEETVNKINENSTDIEENMSRLEAEFIPYKDNITLKTSKIEKELNDYKATMQQVNINQEPKQKATGYGVISLPPNAAEGQVSGVLYGLTATNIIKNGNFLDGTSGWNVHENSATLSVSNNTLIATGTGNSTNVMCHRLFNANILQTGHKYYVRAILRVTNSECTEIRVDFRSSTTQVVVSQNNPVANQWYTLSGIITALGTYTTPYVRITANYPDATTAAGKVTEVWEVIAIDLTVHGLENKTKEELDRMFPYYWNDTKSTVGATRLKSVGKNLFEPTLNGWIKDAGGALTLNDSVFTYKRTSGANFDEIYKFFKVIPNQPYTLQLNVLSIANTVRVRAYDKTIDGTLLGSKTFSNIGLQTITFTPQTEDVVIAFSGSYVNSECSFNFVQLEKGDQATDYEPYRESNAYVVAADKDTGEILELRSLPNGTKDEIDITRGKLIRRTGKAVLNGNENWILASGNEERYIFRILNWTINNNSVVFNRAQNRSAALATNEKDRIIVESAWDLTDWNLEGDIGISASTHLTLIFKANLGITTVQQLKQYLNQYPIQLIYQLAEPIEIPIQVSGTLTSYPNGTIYIERILPDAGVYTDKITILHQDVPIKRLDKLSKVDFMTGVETELDINQAEISEDKLSFTHPDLSEGDIVFFEYEYDVESTDGEAEVEFYDSRYVVKDTETGKFYKWNIVVANGQPSIELVEV